jgi:hypothetical protein
VIEAASSFWSAGNVAVTGADPTVSEVVSLLGPGDAVGAADAVEGTSGEFDWLEPWHPPSASDKLASTRIPVQRGDGTAENSIHGLFLE